MRKAGLSEKQRLTRKQLLEIQSKTNDSAPGPVRTRKATVMAKNKVVDNPKPPKKPARPRVSNRQVFLPAALVSLTRVCVRFFHFRGLGVVYTDLRTSLGLA
jgi:hypothetical protein